MSKRIRRGESAVPRIRRRDRCFLANGSWYLTTREKIYVGPFPTKTMAEAAAKELAEWLVDASDQKAAEAFVREFRRRAIEPPPRLRRA